jgi:hypothetical protein
MGLYSGNLANYYGGLETYGAYQFVSLDDIINQFMVVYVGEDKIISKIKRTDVQFHAMRGMQELSYDTFRSCKTLELEVPPSLLLPLPHDYVEYVKITWIDANGKCHTIRQCKSCPKDPLSYRQHDGSGKHPEGDIDVGDADRGETRTVLVSDAYGEGWDPVITSYTQHGDIQTPIYSKDITDPNNWTTWHDAVYTTTTSTTNFTQNPTIEDSTTWNNLQGVNSDTTNTNVEDYIYHSDVGQRYGLDPQHSNTNGCFWINNNRSHPNYGKIYFDSNLAGKTVTIQYISDGLADYSDMIVHKFAEEAMYKHIAYAVLSTRASADPSIVQLYKKERTAAVRNAKIRLSSIKLEEITQILRGKSKWIKH